MNIVQNEMDNIQLFLKSLKHKLDSKSGTYYHDELDSYLDPESFINKLTISVGSTPYISHHITACINNHSLFASTSNQKKIELHPGNYTLYDRKLLWTGSCKSESYIAGRILTRIIGHYEDRNTIMLDAGSLALTKDITRQGGVCSISGYPNLECYTISHGVILVRTPYTLDRAIPFPFNEFPLGKLVTLLPNHNCTAAASFDRYYVIDDHTSKFLPDQDIVDEWIPAKYF